MAEKFDEFMDEIENDIRQEKYMNLWNRYGKMITGVFSISLIGLIGYSLFSHYQYQQRSKASDIFVGAQEYAQQGRHAEALSAFKSLIDQKVVPYSILSKLNEANLLSLGEEAQKQQAIQIYQEIIHTPAIEQLWQDIALYKKISLQLETPQADVAALLNEIAAIHLEKSPVSALLQELKGILFFQKGDKSQAGEIFVKLAQDKNAPDGVQMRSQLMAQMISAS